MIGPLEMRNYLPPNFDIRTKSVLIGALLLLLVFFVQGILFIRANSQTVDEAVHLAAGYSYLATRDFRLDSEHPPLTTELQALPLFLFYRLPFDPDPQNWRDGNSYLIGRDFLYKSAVSADQILTLSRLPNLFLGSILILFVGWWAFCLWGSHAAILAMTLACFEPNLVAHSSLVTNDLGVTLFVFLAMYFLWEYVNSPTWVLLAATGICTGMALLSKFSALLLLPIISIVTLILLLSSGRPLLLPLNNNANQRRYKFLESTAALFVILFFASLTIPPVYFFQGFERWLSGLQLILGIAQEGRPAFFLGQYSYQGWWNYFVVVFLIKTPLGTLALIFASIALHKFGSLLRWREFVFLLAPVIVFFVVTSQSKVAIGLRYILPVYPFLLVLASRLATVRFQRRWLTLVLVGAPLVFIAISSLRIAPHHLAYFNEFVGGPDQGYRYLSDSNLDWGQDLKGIKLYMEKEKLPIIYLSYFGTAPPSYYGIRYQYVPGSWPLEWPPPADKVPATASRKILAISVYNLQDVSTADYPLFRWLWTRNPIAKIGYSIFIYDLTDDREGLTKLEESYAKAGLRSPP